jgi:Uma2 family endonuclease
VRRENDSDGHDEVWEGLRVMAPLPNNNHQRIQGRFVAVLHAALGWDPATTIAAGVNVSDREKDWQYNYRDPDVVVYLPGNRAKDLGTHWLGGPDFLVEILSPFDRSRDKLPFYGKVGVREVLLVDRDPWGLELFVAAKKPGSMRSVGKTAMKGAPLVSSVLPLSFALVSGKPRPQIEVVLTKASGSNSATPARWRI